MRKSIVAFLAVTALCGCRLSAPAPEKPVELVKNGGSEFQIVLPDQYDQHGTERYLTQAAQRLQSALLEGSGVKLPIIKEAAADRSKPSIFIGNTAAVCAIGFKPAEFQDFNGIIAVRNGNVFIAGNDHHSGHSGKMEHYTHYTLGSVKALVVFMEEYLETRFLLPGEVGTSTPQRMDIVLPGDVTRQITPKIVYASGRPHEMMYDYANNNFGPGSFFSYGGHSYYDAVPKAKYAETHPEYFILKGDVRDASHNHLCISNPEVQNLIYAEILRRLDDGAGTVQLAQTDGYIPCECETCRKFGNTADIGEKLWILHRSLAERLLKDRPGKNVHIIAYSPNPDPPKTFKEFPPNVMIELCKYTPETFAAWSKVKVPQGFTTYIYNWGYYNLTGFTPKRTPEFAGEQVRLFLKNHVRGVYRCGFGENFGLEGPTYYVYGKMLDDPQQNPSALANEYYAAAFGEAAAPMKAFYTVLFDRLKVYSILQKDNGNATDGNPVNINNLPPNPRILLAYIYSPDILDRMEANLDRAEKLAKNTKTGMRLALVRKEFNYAKNLAEIAHLYHAYRTQPNIQTFETLAKKIDARNAMLDGFYDVKGNMNPIPDWNDIRFFSNANRKILAVNGRLTAILGAPYTWNTALLRKMNVLPGVAKSHLKIEPAAAPIETGNFDFAVGAWAKAPWHELRGLQLGEIKEHSRFKIIYDRENLYLGFEAGLAAKKKFTPVGKDGVAWGQDCLEITLDPFGSREKYFHFIFNPVDNSCYDAAFGFITDPIHPLYNQADKNWDGKWDYFNRRSGEKWSAIFRVPFSTLGVESPAAGAIWTLNVYRESFGSQFRGSPELSAWSPNFESMSFHERESFGEAVFP